VAIDGDRIRLRAVAESDLDLLAGLRNDLATQAWSRSLPPDFTTEMVRRRYWDRDFAYRRTDGLFIIEEVASGQGVGFIGYSEARDRHDAVLGLALGQAFWSKGYGREACDLLLWFAFHRLGLRVMRMYTESSNTAMLALAQRLGFKTAVRHRRSIFRDGDYSDNLILDLLREEWYSAHPEFEDHLDEPWPEPSQ